MKKRILFLISDTGGGHRAAAEAIDEAIHHLYPDSYETFVEDIWMEHTPWPVNKLSRVYPWMTGPGVALWKLLWLTTTMFKSHKIIFSGVSPVVQRRITRFFTEINPDIIVSVHPLMNHVAIKSRDKAGLGRVPFLTIVTDMVNIHPAWICPKVTFCAVPTEAARQLAIKFGMLPEKVMVTGQPVSLKFASMSDDKARLRQKLGLQVNRKTILLVSGGEGFGPVFEISRAIARTAPQVQMVVVTGRNSALKRKLDQVHWEIPTKILEFVNNMPELMGAADIFVTKAGPGSISEAFIAKLPIIVFGYIPGQETGNVTYIQEHQAGLLSEDPIEIARLILDLFSADIACLQQMTRNAAALARPEASLTIAQKVCELV
ncbi:MAG TPA: hypothetical protein G4N96_07745 [Chloroflexi bacterium]|nr:hypothetical protein [Chloroflexota bacterium]